MTADDEEDRAVQQRLRRFWRNLTGGSDEDLVACLLAQVTATTEAVELARAMATGEIAPTSGAERMDGVESEGDDARRELILELRRTLATPMDREDLNRLSRSIDDVLDNLRDLAREFDLYGFRDEPLLVEPVDNLAAGLASLRRAIEVLIERPQDAARHAAESKKNDVRRSYQRAMATLLTTDEAVDSLLLRRRELLRRLDITGLRLAEAADALIDGAVKRSH
ncbi:hypothetical protein GCM10011354_27740 [Egicoccus halophilus]|uniref:DUF47 family protein n=1 Tax=Egicoccus halophilus TaxID=1670830 RepID=A0A8J3AGW0_9ACTN|nr:hypothetical protein GCM10011354_27740 [Egicoccus halophilus]